jgi:hypothetical protein
MWIGDVPMGRLCFAIVVVVGKALTDVLRVVCAVNSRVVGK